MQDEHFSNPTEEATSVCEKLTATLNYNFRKRNMLSASITTTKISVKRWGGVGELGIHSLIGKLYLSLERSF